MALTSIGWKLKIVREDHTGNKSTFTRMLTSADHASALVDALQVIGYIQAVSDMTILSYDVSDAFAETAPVAAPYTAQREVVAVMTGRDSVVYNKIHTFNIIGAREDVFDPNAPKNVNFGNLAVAAYFNMASVAGEIYISDGELFADDSWTGGKRTSRKNSNG